MIEIERLLSCRSIRWASSWTTIHTRHCPGFLAMSLSSGNTQANEGKIWTAIRQTPAMPFQVISPRFIMRGNFLFLQSVVINQKSVDASSTHSVRSGHDTGAHDHRSACRNPRNDTATFAEVD